MTTLKFSDGEVFDLSGSYRKECRKDGWYVLGENRMIPVKDELQADEYIYKLSKLSSKEDSHNPLSTCAK
jgi:hypothetical protein